MSANLVQYYANRAGEYDQVYQKPERQADIQQLRAMICALLAAHSVLEVACGTGYWTQDLAQVAASIQAVDVNEPVLEIARHRLALAQTVSFQVDDAYRLEAVQGDFSAGFAGFWWSHIKKAQLASFLNGLHAKLLPGATVVFIDNQYVAGSNHPITKTDDEGNTYQRRHLADGSAYDVLKNFPTEVEFQQLLADRVDHFQLQRLTYYWCLSYQLNTR